LAVRILGFWWPEPLMYSQDCIAKKKAPINNSQIRALFDEEVFHNSLNFRSIDPVVAAWGFEGLSELE